MSDPIDLRVVIFREGDYWLAQGLEHDVGVQGDNVKDLMGRLTFLIRAEGVDRLKALAPALPYFQVLWTLRAGIFTPGADVLVETPGVALVFRLVA